MPSERVANFFLRLGVGFAFLYPSLDAFADPYTWLGYFPKFMHGIVPDMILLHSFGAIEIIIALWILSGKKIFLPSSAATLLLLAIVFCNLQDFQIVFRDISISAMSGALAIMAYNSNPRRL